MTDTNRITPDAMPNGASSPPRNVRDVDLVLRPLAPTDHAKGYLSLLRQLTYVLRVDIFLHCMSTIPKLTHLLSLITIV
jgi:hypothetical protein